MSVLTTTPKVKAESLPRCLRHCSSNDSLGEAKDLAYMLFEVTASLTDTGFSANALRGMGLVFSLLIDKLDIADGSYEFPTLAHGGDLPELARRVEP